MKANKDSGLLGPTGASISTAEVARVRAQANFGFGHSHEGASRGGTFLHGWNPSLRSADADWFWDRDRVVARTRDAARNDVVAASAGARRVNASVGSGWRLSCRANARALGITQEAAEEFSADVEVRFRHYAYGSSFQVDAERKKNFGQLLRLGASHIFYDGEGLGLVEYASDEPTVFKTRLRIVDPDRLSNPFGQMDTPELRRGVKKNAAGIPVGYYIREGHPSDIGMLSSFRWNYWPRFSTSLGRPQVLHVFDETRAGQSRGVSRFVSVLKSLRALTKFTDATLEATTINALFVAFLKSSAGPDAASESFGSEDIAKFQEEREDFYKTNPVSLGGAQIPVLPFGDEIQMATAERQTGGFDPFVRAVLRLIAAALGVTYEELSMDFSQTNYSSARAALAIAWGETQVFSSLIASQLANPLYAAWMEEAFDLGLIKPPKGAPDFYDAIDAYTECRWIGPGRGFIDPTKEIDAAAARVEAQQSTLEDECAENGKDWQEVLQQLAREKKLREQLGIPMIDTALHISAPAMTTGEQAQQRDERPGSSARGRVRDLARSPHHNAALDQRPA
jgi:lambda family phage portal protein